MRRDRIKKNGRPNAEAGHCTAIKMFLGESYCSRSQEGRYSLRFCVNYRNVNSIITKKDVFPLPRVDE